jgi:Family of unknown function (DUF6338)
MMPLMGPDTLQAIAAFALAAVPGVIVLEILEYGRPPLRERSTTRAFALYLILSLLTWATALLLHAADHLAAVRPRWFTSASATVARCTGYSQAEDEPTSRSTVRGLC